MMSEWEDTEPYRPVLETAVNYSLTNKDLICPDDARWTVGAVNKHWAKIARSARATNVF